MRSARTPAKGASTSCGPNWSAMTMPSAVASWSVSSVRTIQLCAVRCIHVPMFEARLPANQIR